MAEPIEMMSIADNNELCRIMDTPVGTPDTIDIDKELQPLLEKLIILGPPPHSENHPAYRQLLRWLVNPQRTTNEINYVIGPLGRHVCIRFRHRFTYDHRRFSLVYLGLAAVETLALKSPVLQGPLGYTAWLELSLLIFYVKDKFPSDHLLPSDHVYFYLS